MEGQEKTKKPYVTPELEIVECSAEELAAYIEKIRTDQEESKEKNTKA